MLSYFSKPDKLTIGLQLTFWVNLLIALVIIFGVSGALPEHIIFGIFLLCMATSFRLITAYPKTIIALNCFITVSAILTIISYCLIHLSVVQYIKPYQLSLSAAVAYLLASLFILNAQIKKAYVCLPYVQSLLSISILIIGLLAIYGYLVDFNIGYFWNIQSHLFLGEALALTLLGIAAVCYNKKMNHSSLLESQYVLPFAVLILGIFVSLMLWQALESRLRIDIFNTLQPAARQIKKLLTWHVNDRINNLLSISQYWQAENGLTEAQWRKYADFIYNNIQGYQAIEWVNPQFKVSWVLPVQSNESVIGLNLSDKRYQEQGAVLAKRYGVPFISNPFRLMQGGNGFLIYVPIYNKNKFEGFNLGVFRTDDFIESTLHINLLRNYYLTIKINNHLLYHSYQVPYSKVWEYVSHFDIQNTRWTLTLHPSYATIAQFSSNLPSISLILGLLLTFAFALACYFLVLFKNKESQLTVLAHYDPVTGLCNRAFFMELLDKALSKSKKTQSKMALLYIDMDNFKRINDTYGHDVGDKILKQAAQRLRKIHNHHNGVARLGGDEFTILLSDIKSHESINTIAEKLIDQFNLAFIHYHTELYVTLSIGIALYPVSGLSVTELMRNADIALYYAKSKGKNNYQYFSEELNTRVKREVMIATQLQRAISMGEFTMVYQPQLDIKNMNVVGLEALIRWQSPVLGEVEPGEFIPIAEENGLIQEIGYWVVRESCAQYVRWRQHFGDAFEVTLNINVSALQVTRQFTDQFISIVNDMRIDPGRIALEITESAILQNIEMAAAVLNQLDQSGHHIAIDDFGTGYASLTYLKNLPIGTLKIDQSFIHDIGMYSNADSIVPGVIQLAKTLGLYVIAEGVETVAQLMFLQLHHCDCAQGYFFSKPLMPEEVVTFLSKRYAKVEMLPA